MLDGQEELGFEYDEAGDILYLWRGEEPRDAVSFETDDGNLLRVDEETLEIVGVTIFDWSALDGKGSIELKVAIDVDTLEGLGSHRLELCPA